MTIINGIEIDDINYKVNDIKYAITNNEPIENKLNVIIVVSNPCLYATRYILLKEFVKRFEDYYLVTGKPSLGLMPILNLKIVLGR